MPKNIFKVRAATLLAAAAAAASEVKTGSSRESFFFFFFYDPHVENVYEFRRLSRRLPKAAARSNAALHS